MSKTRVESYSEMVNAVKNDSSLNAGDVIVLFLTEIAGSLAVIADYMTAKKEGDAE